MNSGLIKFGLDALYYSGAGSAFSPLCRGEGIIFTLHNVRPAAPQAFQPNAILDVTPEFLDAVIPQVRRHGFDIVSLDEAHRRIVAPGNDRPFACFTFDDGYRNNREFAYPVLKRHGCPFTVFVTTAFSDGEGELWWLALEEVIRRTDRLSVPGKEGANEYPTGTTAEKYAAFNSLYFWLRNVELIRQRETVRQLAAAHDVDMRAMCRELAMDWQELRELAADPLATIGAHTVHHYALARLPEAEARREIADSIAIIADRLGMRPEHFAYPYGDPGSAGQREFRLAAELGLKTATTTRKGVIFAEHRDHLTALPRVSLNGDYQSARYVDLFLTGTPFMLWNRFKRLNVA